MLQTKKFALPPALAGLLLLTIGSTTPVRAADDACKLFLDATKKVMVTPTHMYSTETAGFRNNKPENTETIYTGGLKGAIYVMVKGKWSRSKLTPEDMVKQKDESVRTGKNSCRYLRDESVNGEPAAVYTTHIETEGAKVDVTAWVSKSKGLPLREETDMDVGGGARGKSHRSTRFDYSNVHPPDGVK
jgi:hypothetical protein